MFTLVLLMAVSSGVDVCLSKRGHTPAVSFAAMTALSDPRKGSAPEIPFLGRTYRLASFNQKNTPQWEFVTDGEKIDDWKTLVTVIERADVHSREQLDNLAGGIASTYQSHGAQILMAKTMQATSGAVFNYVLAAFEEPAKHRFELNFVKAALGSKSGVVMIYGVRISDPHDYLRKAREFLTQNSGEVGHALGNADLPDVSKLPRKEF